MDSIARNVLGHARRLPASVQCGASGAGRSISGSSKNPHIAMVKQPASGTAPLPGLAGKRWPGNGLLSSSSMQLIARRYQRTPLHVWQRYQMQSGVAGANAGSDEHRSSLNSFALTTEEMVQVDQAGRFKA